MRLDVHMTPRQYREGLGERIAKQLGEGSFRALAGTWRVRRQLVLIEPARRGILLRQVTFDLAPLDTVALRIAQRQRQGSP